MNPPVRGLVQLGGAGAGANMSRPGRVHSATVELPEVAEGGGDEAAGIEFTN